MTSHEEFLKKFQPFPSRAKVWWILHAYYAPYSADTRMILFFGSWKAFKRKFAGWISLEGRAKPGFKSLSILGARGERYFPPKEASKMIHFFCGCLSDSYGEGAGEYVLDL